MRFKPGLIGVALLAVAATACSSSASNRGTASNPSTNPSTTPTSVQPAPCVPPAAAAVVATRVPGVASDWTLTSFDGTKIRMHWFPAPTATAAHRAPTVLMGPGWGAAGDTNTSTVGLFGSLGIGALQARGYNVLTWDPRGFGQSTGTVEIDSADFEGRDVQRMFDWIATQPQVQLDGPRDPRVGMAGGSYGGGIQLIAAAIDCRVDAIVPMIAWHSLSTSLYKADTPKNGWSGLLYAAAAGRSLDPHIHSAYASSITNAIISQADQDWFASRGPADLVKRITIPTLIVQGTVDTLFTLDEGITNYRILRERRVPTAMLWFCGGHGACLTDAGDPNRVGTATMAWLDRYLKRDASVDTGPRFDFIDQNGKRYPADDYPLPAGNPITAAGSGTLRLIAAGGSGPAHPTPGSKDPLVGVAAAIAPAKATNAVAVAVRIPTAAVVIGAPKLTLTYSGTNGCTTATCPDGPRPTRVFAQLVDDTTGLVLGNQATPIAVTLDGKSHTTQLPLEDVVFAGRAGTHLTLQLVASTVSYAVPQLGGHVDFTNIGISLPVAAGVAPK